MKESLLELICCPGCRGALDLHASEEGDAEIWGGKLVCQKCGDSYEIENGMPLLYVDDDYWRSKAIEAVGWVEYHKNMGIYEQLEDSVDLKIPYYPEEPWIRVAKSFDIALELLNLTGSETILDLGAGRGWAAKHFAKRGCRVVALDIVTDENVGLGRGKVLMKEAGVYYDRIIADGENLPLFDGIFDLVFCAAALHHTSKLGLLLTNIWRVLKDGGRICAINEPCISVLEDETKTLEKVALEEIELGINENRPNFIKYLDCLTASGFNGVELFPSDSYGMDMISLAAWARGMGAITPRLLSMNLVRTAREGIFYLGRRVLAFKQRTLFQARRVVASEKDERRRIERAVLVWVGGELFLVGSKADATDSSPLQTDRSK